MSSITSGEGRAVHVWFNDEDHEKLRRIALMADYKHLSTFLRDRALGRDGLRLESGSGAQAWEDRQELVMRMAQLEESVRTANRMLAMLMGLARSRATSGEVAALASTWPKAASPKEFSRRSRLTSQW